jgi:peptidoglycan/xylan/chitin deacetylase (PgdA/CDA1 family)
MMRWSEVRQLAEAGMEIGSHTVSHPVLGNLADAAAITAELAESRRRLQAETGRAVKVISYPVGRSTTVTGEVVRLAQDAGYAYGCVYQHGVNPKAGFDPFRLLRIKTEVGSDFDRFRAKVLFPAWVRY